MPWRVCTVPGCGTLHEGTGKCPEHRAQAERDRRPHGTPYNRAAHRSARETVLARQPRCVCPGDCGKHTGWCGAEATVADHHPHERVDLVAMGENPDDPKWMRGLCKPCHDAKTARTKPSGWNARD